MEATREAERSKLCGLFAQPGTADEWRRQTTECGEITVPKLIEPPPSCPIEVVTEILHGVSVSDPYRWLEDQESPQTRAWIPAQTQFARSYLDGIPGRERIRERVRELLDVETYDSFQKVGNRYFFRKRLPGQEQPCIYSREGPHG